MDLTETVMMKSYELFKRYGIRSVTMDEIAVQCGMSKKTVYQAFADKDSLIGAIMDFHIKHAETNCISAKLESENAIHEIFLSLDWVHKMFDGVNPALLFDLRKYHSSVYMRLEDHKRKFLYDIFKKNFERGIEEGVYREDIKIDIMVPLRIHTMTLVFDHDLFPTSKYTLYDIDKEITLHGLYGMATTKGIKLIEKYIKQRLK
jgi:TetR/AcrR family transcriptional regulator, cholesterol catabolism regulator